MISTPNELKVETTQSDPVIAAVRAVRDGFAAQSHDDVEAIFRRIRQMQDESGREYVTCRARRIAEDTDESLAI